MYSTESRVRYTCRFWKAPRRASSRTIHILPHLAAPAIDLPTTYQYPRDNIKAAARHTARQLQTHIESHRQHIILIYTVLFFY